MEDYKIDAEIIRLNSIQQLKKDDIFTIWNETNRTHFHCIVESISNTSVTAKKMAIDGIAIKIEEREIFKLTSEVFKNNRLSVILDKTNDKHLWPKNVEQAVRKLKSLYQAEELYEIKKMTWEDFEKRFNDFGGLSMWIRNYFGLYKAHSNFESPCQVAYSTCIHQASATYTFRIVDCTGLAIGIGAIGAGISGLLFQLGCGATAIYYLNQDRGDCLATYQACH